MAIGGSRGRHVRVLVSAGAPRSEKQSGKNARDCSASSILFKHLLLAAILDREKWRIRSEKCERGCSGSLVVMLEQRGICAPAIIVVGNSVDSLVRPRYAGLQLEVTKQIGTAAHNACWNVLVILPFSCYLGSQVAGKNGALTKVAVLHATFPKVEVFGFSLFTTYIVFICLSLLCGVTFCMHDPYLPLQ